MSDPLEAAASFNRAVESTAVVGALKADVAAIKTDVGDVKTDVGDVKKDVRHIRTTVDRWGGAVAVISTVISLAVGVIGSIVVPIFTK